MSSDIEPRREGCGPGSAVGVGHPVKEEVPQERPGETVSLERPFVPQSRGPGESVKDTVG